MSAQQSEVRALTFLCARSQQACERAPAVLWLLPGSYPVRPPARGVRLQRTRLLIGFLFGQEFEDFIPPPLASRFFKAVGEADYLRAAATTRGRTASAGVLL